MSAFGFGVVGKTGGFDRFGVKQLNPTKQGGEEWFLNMTSIASDSRFVPQATVTRNADGLSYKIVDESAIRMEVLTSQLYTASKINTYNHCTYAGRGWMMTDRDWKNVEMTGFVKINTTTDATEDISWYARGGKHQADNGGCEGCSLKINLTYEGNTRHSKEQQHTDGYNHTAYTNGVAAALTGRWVGWKAVIYNNGQNNPVLQSWLNESADRTTWTKVLETIDTGAWGTSGSLCSGCTAAQKITWGGPIATFRLDAATDVDFKWLSVREITPPN